MVVVVLDSGGTLLLTVVAAVVLEVVLEVRAATRAPPEWRDTRRRAPVGGLLPVLDRFESRRQLGNACGVPWELLRNSV